MKVTDLALPEDDFAAVIAGLLYHRKPGVSRDRPWVISQDGELKPLTREEAVDLEAYLRGPGWYAPAAECPDCGGLGMPCRGPHGAD